MNLLSSGPVPHLSHVIMGFGFAFALQFTSSIEPANRFIFLGGLMVNLGLITTTRYVIALSLPKALVAVHRKIPESDRLTFNRVKVCSEVTVRPSGILSITLSQDTTGLGNPVARQRGRLTLSPLTAYIGPLPMKIRGLPITGEND